MNCKHAFTNLQFVQSLFNSETASSVGLPAFQQAKNCFQSAHADFFLLLVLLSSKVGCKQPVAILHVAHRRRHQQTTSSQSARACASAGGSVVYKGGGSASGSRSTAASTFFCSQRAAARAFQVTKRALGRPSARARVYRSCIRRRRRRRRATTGRGGAERAREQTSGSQASEQANERFGAWRARRDVFRCRCRRTRRRSASVVTRSYGGDCRDSQMLRFWVCELRAAFFLWFIRAFCTCKICFSLHSPSFCANA